MNRPVNRIGALVLLGLAVTLAAAPPAPAQTRPGASTQDLAAARPRIIVRPRRIEPGPNARRYCRFWLAQEFRVSGTVIVPRTYCWWQ
jgi:hypothetical protein